MPANEFSMPDLSQVLPLIMALMTGDERAKEALAETGRQFVRGFEEEYKRLFAECVQPLRDDINTLLAASGLPVRTES